MFLNRIFISCALIFAFSLNVASQDRIFFTLFPGISITAPIAGKLDLNLNSSAQYNTIGNKYEEKWFPAAFNYVDLQLSGIYKYNQSLQISAAWYYRQSHPGTNTSFVENRFWQQITIISRVNNLRVRNRIRIEERLISSNGKADLLRWRLRYLAGIEIPLQGEKTDVREFYLTFSNEAYFNLSKPRNAIYSENWLSGLIGYRLTQLNRIEAGPVWQAQVRNPAGDFNHLFHLQVNLFIQLNLSKTKQT